MLDSNIGQSLDKLYFLIRELQYFLTVPYPTSNYRTSIFFIIPQVYRCSKLVERQNISLQPVQMYVTPIVNLQYTYSTPKTHFNRIFPIPNSTPTVHLQYTICAVLLVVPPLCWVEGQGMYCTAK